MQVSEVPNYMQYNNLIDTKYAEQLTQFTNQGYPYENQGLLAETLLIEPSIKVSRSFG